MRYEFTKVCETGIQLIDTEHKKFFTYINSALEALEGDDEEALITAKNILKKLRDYADVHFKDEEEYMKDIHDAELVSQIREHEAFKVDIDKMIGEGVSTKEDVKSIVIFLTKWLYRHILTSDTLIGKEHTSGRFYMGPDFMTGIEIVDEEHKNLFAIINRAWDVLDDDLIFDKYDPILGILNELKVYTQRHFSDEEEYMESIKYDGLDAQKRVHEAFIEKVVNLDLSEVEGMDDNQNEYLKDLLSFLNDWLINHILKMDKKIPVKK